MLMILLMVFITFVEYSRIAAKAESVGVFRKFSLLRSAAINCGVYVVSNNEIDYQKYED